MRIYQITKEGTKINPDEHQLLNVHYVSSFTTGWQVFKVKRAVDSWLKDSKTNLGIFISATTVLNEPVDITFSRRNNYGLKYQPSLIIFAKESNKGN